jgi:hypothetical protein
VELAVPWLTVLRLPDGSRVESSLLSVKTVDTGPTVRAYRLFRADGTVSEFSTLTAILRHLGDHYDPDDLSRATGTDGAPAAAHRDTP